MNPAAFYRSMQQKHQSAGLYDRPRSSESQNNQHHIKRIAGSQEIEQRLAELSSIAVHPSHKGRGIGKELVAAFTAHPR